MKSTFNNLRYNGQVAEQFVNNFLNEKGLISIIMDQTDYDILCEGKKIEVKSAMILKKDVYQCNKFRLGKFRFHDDRKESYLNSDVWLCFVVTFYGQCIILGFQKARELELKNNTAFQYLVGKIILPDEFISLMRKQQ